jgi:hypothetical protein
MTTEKKAKRKLSDIDFSKEDAHVALVHKDQGGPANGHDYSLILKSSNFSPEFVQKMQQIQVTMELPEFLQKFFGMWCEDAELLAKFLGYEGPEEEDEVYSSNDYYEKWMEDKLASFTVIKSLHESKNLAESLAKLSEDQYLNLLKDQEFLEKSLNKLTNEINVSKDNTSTSNVEKQVGAKPSRVNSKKEKPMANPEMVEKSQYTTLEKAVEEQKVELQKAQEIIKKYQEAEIAAVIKSKTSVIKSVIKNDKDASIVLKAALALDNEEDFDALVNVFKSLNQKLEASGIFDEKGVSGESQNEDENLVAKILKSQVTK